MPFPYYVVPEYWVEGYAEGDAKIAAAPAVAASTFAANGALLKSAAMLASAAASASVAATRVRLAGYADSVSSSVSATATRARLAASDIAVTVTTSSTALAIYLVSAVSSVSVVVSVSTERVRNVAFSVAVVTASIFSARKKWEGRLPENENWQRQELSDNIWVEQDPESGNWS